jgi:hypothetical protein
MVIFPPANRRASGPNLTNTAYLSAIILNTALQSLPGWETSNGNQEKLEFRCPQ